MQSYLFRETLVACQASQSSHGLYIGKMQLSKNALQDTKQALYVYVAKAHLKRKN